MIYIDTSAAVKALIGERGSDEVRRLFAEGTGLISSRLLAVELHAVAIRRRLDPTEVDALLAHVSLASLDDEVAAEAIELRFGLRALDALHLATALNLNGIVTQFAAFDVELNEAAQRAGLELTAWNSEP